MAEDLGSALERGRYGAPAPLQASLQELVVGGHAARREDLPESAESGGVEHREAAAREPRHDVVRVLVLNGHAEDLAASGDEIVERAVGAQERFRFTRTHRVVWAKRHLSSVARVGHVDHA